jgi:hypothetical protein
MIYKCFLFINKMTHEYTQYTQAMQFFNSIGEEIKKENTEEHLDEHVYKNLEEENLEEENLEEENLNGKLGEKLEEESLEENLNENLQNLNEKLEENPTENLQNLNENLQNLNENLEENPTENLQNLNENLQENLNENLQNLNENLQENLNENLQNLNEKLEENLNKKLEENLKVENNILVFISLLFCCCFGIFIFYLFLPIDFNSSKLWISFADKCCEMVYNVTRCKMTIPCVNKLELWIYSTNSTRDFYDCCYWFGKYNEWRFHVIPYCDPFCLHPRIF